MQILSSSVPTRAGICVMDVRQIRLSDVPDSLVRVDRQAIRGAPPSSYYETGSILLVAPHSRIAPSYPCPTARCFRRVWVLVCDEGILPAEWDHFLETSVELGPVQTHRARDRHNNNQAICLNPCDSRCCWSQCQDRARKAEDGGALKGISAGFAPDSATLPLFALPEFCLIANSRCPRAPQTAETMPRCRQCSRLPCKPPPRLV